jgi:hypothetical protein
MPIPSDRIIKTFVSVPDTATVAQALTALQQAGGYEWWTLLIARSDGQIAATSVSVIHRLLLDRYGSASFAVRLADLSVAENIRKTVETDSTTLAQAEEDARHSPGKILVVTEKNVPVGLIGDLGIEREMFTSSLVQLYGEYTKLSQDARAAWKPGGKEPPTQPCGHKAWPELDASGKWVCNQCKKPIET